jgi:hypothetical protein
MMALVMFVALTAYLRVKAQAAGTETVSDNL